MKKYNKADQKDILEKFYEGETSLEEEKEMLVRSGNEPGGAESDLFRFFEYERKAGPQPFPMEKLNSGSRFLFIAKIAASSSLLFLIAYLLYSYLSKESIPVKWVEIATENEQREVDLPDGTVVTLNSHSLLKYPESFTERYVQLEGEGFFEVTPDPASPFKVVAGKVTTEVLGTAFNLTWRPGDMVAELEVKEGKVAFSSFGQDLNERIFVVAGERAVYDEEANTIRKFETFDPNLLAWKTRQLVFKDATLQKLLEDAEAYFDVEFVADEIMVSKCHFSGTFDNPSLDDVLKALEYVLDIKHEQNGKVITLKGGGC